jgi:hypothetical protein
MILNLQSDAADSCAPRDRNELLGLFPASVLRMGLMLCKSVKLLESIFRIEEKVFFYE